MRYHYSKPSLYTPVYGETYECNHTVYNRCTLFRDGLLGLAIIQQRFDSESKRTYWTELDDWLPNELYLNQRFAGYFNERKGEPLDGIYPTVTLRQAMWALKMKPLKRERWETVFDRRFI